MGNIIGGITNALFGKGGSATAQAGIEEAAQRAEQAYFRPYTVTASGTGTAGYDPNTGAVTTSLAPGYAAMQGGATMGAAGLIPGLLGAIGQPTPQFGGYGQGLMDLAAIRSAQAPQQFGYTSDLAGRTQEIFGQQAELLQPEFQRQATELQGKLFGGGRLGLRLAGESQGLGEGSGMVSPDALGLGRAQQQTLSNLATQSRQQALGEEAQMYQQALGGFQANQATQQQALQNLLAAQGQGFSQAAQAYGIGQAGRQAQIANMLGLQQGLFGQALGLGQLEQGLYQPGLVSEQARAASALGAGQLAVSPYATAADIAERQREGNAGFFGDAVGAAGAVIAASDIRLKENINHVDTLPNGIKLYTWDWKEERNDPTFGVIAQEISQVIPEAVIEHPDGYLMVNYAHPELKGVH